jgi:ABC-2 type transport system ATP-binding protein
VPAIDVTGLMKSFPIRGGTVEAVRGVDLTVGRGETLGLLGTNGAGKTTTLRMLATLIRPDGGRAEVGGADLLADPAGVRRAIGYLPQDGSTWGGVTAREELVLHARMYGIAKAQAKQRAERVIGAFALTEFADRKCATYSGGQRRRVDIALAIIHEPAVLFLDEPTTGLDPQSRAHVWDEVRRLRADGMAIVLSTHYLDEADELCDRVSIMDNGQVVAEGAPRDLKREITGDVVSVGGLAGRDDAAERAVKLLRDQVWVRGVDDDAGPGVRLFVDDGATAVPLVLHLLEGDGLSLSSIEVHRPSLADVFLARTGRSLREL